MRSLPATSSRWRPYSFEPSTCSFFIEVDSRRLHFSASTSSPDTLFVTQQVRNLYIEEEAPKVRFLIHDRDAKFACSFDEVFRTEGVHVYQDPHPGPERQRLRRALDPDYPGRGDRPRARARTAAP